MKNYFKDLLEFSKMSWKYMEGQRILFFVGFIPAWRGYRKAREHHG